jgi:hypothetical protein
MIEENIRRKIENLLGRAPALAAMSGSGLAVSQCFGWLTEALNIVEVAVPAPNNAYRRQIEKMGDDKRSSRYPQTVGSIAEVLHALLSDIDEGLLTTLANRVRAETFDVFLDHADLYLKERRKQEAGVIAGVVFEDTIRRICRNNGINDKDQQLEDLINALTKKDVITGLQSKQAKVASHVRTKATHAQWDEFDLEGVTDTIQITKRFLREHLDG